MEDIEDFLEEHGNVKAAYNEELKCFLFGRQLQVELPENKIEKVQVQHLPQKQNAVLVEIEEIVDDEIHQNDVVQTEKFEFITAQKKIFPQENELEKPKDIPLESETIPDNKSVFETILATTEGGDLIEYIWMRFELHSNEEILTHVSSNESLFKFVLNFNN